MPSACPCLRGFPRGLLLPSLLVLAVAGCRSTVRADPREWTVERATEVVRRVENLQVLCVREGAWFTTHGISLEETRPGGAREGWGEMDCDASGFADFRLLPEAEDGPTFGEFLATVFFENLLGEVGVKSVAGPSSERWAEYGVARISFADIERVVIARKAYPLYGLLIVVGPWFYDVDLEMKDGSCITVYRWASAWLNLLPCWLYPAEWVHTLESEEYAQAIDYLRARATGESPEK